MKKILKLSLFLLLISLYAPDLSAQETGTPLQVCATVPDLGDLAERSGGTRSM